MGLIAKLINRQKIAIRMPIFIFGGFFSKNKTYLCTFKKFTWNRLEILQLSPTLTTVKPP